jgi:dTMP kinase
VILDRYYPSGIVFSAAKHDASLSLIWCRAPDIGLPLPDLTFFLSLTTEEAAARGAGYGEEKYEKKEMQDRARKMFEQVIVSERKAGVGNWVEIDAGRTMDEVQEELVRVSEDVIGRVDGEVGVVPALD